MPLPEFDVQADARQGSPDTLPDKAPGVRSGSKDEPALEEGERSKKEKRKEKKEKKDKKKSSNDDGCSAM
ncbi:unnamed protein product [Symbiodinium pilosum]|uniref:Uncharacterized protein n=1 Tax=Symbiodinium pilosum TaxID=2952 RepID=A0A812VQW4_SYMPI|nr:unnamed protein product [Symbiodinium pilosum]